MDDILASAQLGNGRSVHIATLARQTIIDSEAEHLGFGGYFLFEANDLPGEKGINILGKVSSFEAAIALDRHLDVTALSGLRSPFLVGPIHSC